MVQRWLAGWVVVRGWLMGMVAVGWTWCAIMGRVIGEHAALFMCSFWNVTPHVKSDGPIGRMELCFVPKGVIDDLGGFTLCKQSK